MKGDKILIRPIYYSNAQKILTHFIDKLNKEKKVVISVGGESGSGKSVTATCLKKCIEDIGFNTIILHQDDYFLLPPKTNHNNRVNNINNVGTHEVNLKLIEKHIEQFKNIATKFIEKPLVDYDLNIIEKETINVENINVLIIEGTYVSILNDIDFKIFINRTYKDTYENRKQRNRETESEFIETVLDIEHHIIKQHINTANLIIQKDYSIFNPQEI